MGTNQLDAELESLIQQRLDNLSEQLSILEDLSNNTVTFETRISRLDELIHLRNESDEISEAIEENYTYYRRPSGRISGLFSRVLGPLPHNFKETKIDDRAEEVIASLPSYRFAAFGLLLGVISTLLTLGSMFPWLMVSPFTLSMDAISVGETSQSNALTIIMGVLTLFIAVAALLSRTMMRHIIFSAAHDEEKWFRSGAEKWTPGQRLISCVSFGFCHVINIIYPFLTLAVLSLVGVAFMAAYLSEYRRSNDVYRATLASTKLHARYNIYASWFMGGVLMLLAVITFM